MLNYVSGICLSTTKPLRTTDTTLTIRNAQALQLNKVGLGNHIFLELVYNGNLEVIRYDHNATIPTSQMPTTISVTRDVEGTGIYNFPTATQARVGINKSTLLALIAQVISSGE